MSSGRRTELNARARLGIGSAHCADRSARDDGTPELTRSGNMRIARTIMTTGALATPSLLVLFLAEPAQAQGVGARPNLDAIKRDYRRPALRPVENQALADLGR